LFDGGLQGSAKPAALGLQVDKRNGLAHWSPKLNVTALV
jgi:hypothetical protein